MKHHSVLRSLASFAIAFAVLLSAWAPGRASAAPNAVVSISPPAGPVQPGVKFAVNINVTPNSPIAGVQFKLGFDPSVVAVQSIAEGDLFRKSGANTYFDGGSVNGTSGTITYVFGAVIGPGRSVSAAGTFAVITMTAKKSGSSALTLSDVVIGDPQGNSVPVITTDTSVTSTPPPILPPPPAPIGGGSTWGGGGGSGIIARATPAFSDLNSTTITYGSPTVALAGSLKSPSGTPRGTVSVHIGGLTTFAEVDALGHFSLELAAGNLTVKGSPYAVTYDYAGDAVFASAADLSTTLTVLPAPATITLGGLSQVFDRGSKAVATTTQPEGLSVLNTYDSSSAPPSEVGSYGVLSTVADPNYVGTATGTMTILKATPTFSELRSQILAAGSSTVAVSGKVRSGDLAAAGLVSVTVGGSAHTGLTDPDGYFSIDVPIDYLDVGGSPYTVVYNFAGNSNFSAASDSSTTLTLNDTPAATPHAPDSTSIGLFSVTPRYTAEKEIDYAEVEYQIAGTAAEDSQLVFKVSLDGRPLEEISIAVPGPEAQTPTYGTWSYVPSRGWDAGSYSFAAELYAGGELRDSSLKHRLDVAPPPGSIISGNLTAFVIGSVFFTALAAAIVSRSRGRAIG